MRIRTLRIARTCGLGLALLCAGSAAETLENRHVSVAMDPQRGGAVTAMMHKRAVRIPFQEDRGAEVADKG